MMQSAEDEKESSMLTKDTAICIRTTDYSETSQIVTLFTRKNGKISAIAKGSKRPKSAFDGPIEILSYGEIVFSDSNREKLATLTEFEQKPVFSCAGDNLFALNCCLFGAEMVNSLTNEYDPHIELFDGFLRFLREIDKKQRVKNEGRKVMSLLIQFQLTLLKEVGLMPILDGCANCKTRYERQKAGYEVYFSSSGNGLICRDCEGSFPDKIKLSKNAAGCLINADFGVGEKVLSEVEKVLVRHFTEILHKQPRMAKYVLGG